LQALGDCVGGFEDKEGLAALTKLHGIILLDSIDFELDLFIVGSK
jgi:hypothetical protein